MNTAPSQTKGTVAPTSAASKSHRVRFEFTFPDAGSVCLVGTFNDWHPAVSPMIALGQGRWAKELMLPPGTYQYAVVVDGKWMADPLGKESFAGPLSLFSLLQVPAPDTPSETGSAEALKQKAAEADPQIQSELGPAKPRLRAV
ncbi:MAG: glycogen-binding domain-containing protein [Limisphaerales bacterium]